MDEAGHFSSGPLIVPIFPPPSRVIPPSVQDTADIDQLFFPPSCLVAESEEQLPLANGSVDNHIGV